MIILVVLLVVLLGSGAYFLKKQQGLKAIDLGQMTPIPISAEDLQKRNDEFNAKMKKAAGDTMKRALMTKPTDEKTSAALKAVREKIMNQNKPK